MKENNKTSPDIKPTPPKIIRALKSVPIRRKKTFSLGMVGILVFIDLKIKPNYFMSSPVNLS